MNKIYSKGVFLNIVSKDKKNWKEQASFIDSLPNVEHVEVLLEESLTLPEIKYLKTLLRRYEIIVHGPFSHLSLISSHQEVREVTVKLYLRTLKIAEALGAKLVTFHCGSRTKFVPKEAAIKIFIQNIKKIKKLSKGRVPFTIENDPAGMRGIQFYYPSFLKDLVCLKRSLPWLTFTLDIGHAFQNGEGLNKISKFLRTYKRSILDIHLHDAKLKGKDHLSLGKGDLKVGPFFQLLDKINYKNYLTLETVVREDTKKSWEKIHRL